MRYRVRTHGITCIGTRGITCIGMKFFLILHEKENQMVKPEFKEYVTYHLTNDYCLKYTGMHRLLVNNINMENLMNT